MVRIDNLSKRFFSLRGEVAALRGLSLDIHDKEFFVLLGPSGCGKSTLLNLIAGLDSPTGGQIWFDDAVMADADRGVCLSPRKRNVAMVFQSYALYPHLSVFDNIAFPLSIAGMRKDEIAEAVREATDMLELADLLAAKPAELSGGQRQRVAIARALVRKPSVFLLDEPLSNLDAQLRASMRTELKSLQRRLGITTIYVTHDQVEAMSLGDRVAVLHDGRLEQTGSPQELYHRPANAFVGTFIGSPPMNLFEASWREADGRPHVEIMNMRLEIPLHLGQRLRALKGASFLLGMRPENIHAHFSTSSPLGLMATVRSAERLGRETLLHLARGEHRLTALTSAGDFTEGAEISVEFDWDHAHFLARSER
ncbi:MAG: ABC transporter ATP-binding protein [Elusimicrobia bacterium]|nr:ABC transporter ATP-binding protein [Elusimicrobiota bacterium]